MEQKIGQKPIVVVSGITGCQGGSVARALLDDGRWRVRGLTRNADSEKANELRSQGVEIIQLDFKNNFALVEALKSCYAFFAVTNYWDPNTKDVEIEVGKGMVDAAISAGIKHFIWSSLPNVELLSEGKYKVPPFTNKAIVQGYAEQKMKEVMYTTYVAPGFYFQNFKTVLAPKLENDVLVFTMPNTKMLHAMDINDLGAAVLTILHNPEVFNGRFVPLFGEHIPLKEYIPPIGYFSDKSVRFVLLPWQEYSKLPIPGAAEIGEMFGWFNDFSVFGKEVDIEIMNKASPKLKSWKEWLQSSWNLPA